MSKVVIDNIVYSIQKIGGISQVFYEITTRLMRDSIYKVEFLECENANENFYRKLLDIPIVSITYFAKKWLKLFRYINPKPGIKDTYIFHSSYYRTSRDKSAINVTTVHDFTYERSKSRSFASLVHIWQQKRAVVNSDIVVCISENTKRDLLYYYKNIDENKIHVVYNGVSDEYKKLLSLDCIELPFEIKTYCIYVGVRRKYKNYDLVVDAISKTKYKLVLIGSSLTKEEKEVLDFKLGHDRYLCLSGVSNDRLNQLYNGAFCLLYLSSYEGFGIPCLEAQKAGCPVIAYNSSSIPEVVCNKNMLVDSLDVASVLNVINKLKSTEYRTQIINEGIAFAEKFSWDKTYRDLSALYQKAMNKTMNTHE